MSVGDRFQTLIGRIEPTWVELQKYKSHETTVRARLKAAFGDIKVEVIGSHSRETAVRGSSDLDLMAHLPRSAATWGSNWKNSKTVLNEVRGQLQDRYTTTEVGRDGQAVVIDFGGGDYSVDVVPAIFEGMAYVAALGAQRPMFLIPDGDGGWLRTSPGAHNEFIWNADRQSGGKLKHVARLLKFWRICRNPRVPILSFHVDMLLAYSGVCVGVKTYSRCVSDALALLRSRGLAALRDPLEISGNIRAASTAAKLASAQASVNASAEHAAKAMLAEIRGPLPAAYQQWDMVFNGNYPSR